MNNIDIKNLDSIKEELELLTKEKVVLIEEDGVPKYALTTLEEYSELESYRNLVVGQSVQGNDNEPAVKIVASRSNELSFEEYEKVKEELVEMFDKTFKPNPKKLS